MVKKLTLSAAAFILAFSPAFAAEYHVAKEASTNKCEVTEKKPDGKMWMAVGKTHKTKAEAEAAMKAAPECK